MGCIVHDISSIVPDIVFRPSKFKRLRVRVPTDTCSPEWMSGEAVEVYPELPVEGDRHARFEYLKALDRSAYEAITPYCHSPPLIHS